MTGKTSTSEERQVQNRLASAQQFLARLTCDLESSGFRPNSIVSLGIENGAREVDAAVESMASEDYESAARSTNIAWLYAYFARGIFDAEMTEHYLGDSKFLELQIDVADWKQFVASELQSIEKEIVELREKLAAETGNRSGD